MAKKGEPEKGKPKTPLKKFTIGFEVEFFVIDKATGRMAPGADAILKKADEKSSGKTHTIIHECADERRRSAGRFEQRP